jgi:hypothetical protein
MTFITSCTNDYYIHKTFLHKDLFYLFFIYCVDYTECYIYVCIIAVDIMKISIIIIDTKIQNLINKFKYLFSVILQFVNRKKYL